MWWVGAGSSVDVLQGWRREAGREYLWDRRVIFPLQEGHGSWGLHTTGSHYAPHHAPHHRTHQGSWLLHTTGSHATQCIGATHRIASGQGGQDCQWPGWLLSSVTALKRSYRVPHHTQVLYKIRHLENIQVSSSCLQGVFFYWSPLKCLSNFFELDTPNTVGGVQLKKNT